MDKIQRVRSAIAGHEVDRIPAGFLTHFPPAASTGRAMADAHLDFYRRSGVDFVKVMNDNPYRLVGSDRIDRPSDWRRSRPEPRDSSGRLACLDGVKAILDAVGHEALVIVTVFNPFATANDNRSGSLDFSDLTFGGISAHLKEDPEATAAGLQVIAESLAMLAVDCVEAGAAGVFFSANGAERGRFSAEEFEHHIGRTDRVVLDAARASGATFNLLHVCGADQRLEAYAGHAVDVVNWAPQMSNPSLVEGRRLRRDRRGRSRGVRVGARRRDGVTVGASAVRPQLPTGSTLSSLSRSMRLL
jgi:uroporphyrinogen decarboxylase